MIRQVNSSEYYESHHIIPKCLLKHKSDKIVNGKWNLVKLTGREHFIAHLLLWKISKNTKYENKMRYGVIAMSRMKEIRTGRLYQKIREDLHNYNVFSKGKTKRYPVKIKKQREVETRGAKKGQRKGIENKSAAAQYEIMFYDERVIQILNISKFCKQNNFIKSALIRMCTNQKGRHKNIISVRKL